MKTDKFFLNLIELNTALSGRRNLITCQDTNASPNKLKKGADKIALSRGN